MQQHIEVAESLEADSFINALRRFISRRGMLKVIISDNGTNLSGGERGIRESISNSNKQKIEFDSLTIVRFIRRPSSGSLIPQELHIWDESFVQSERS